MKNYILTYLLIPFYLSSYAQNSSISGTLTNIDNKPITSVTIQLFKSEDLNNLIKGTITDDKGQFAFSNLSAGTYIIEISHINYDPYFREIILLENEKRDLGTIQLKEQLQQLNEIVISGKKLPITQTADKITVNVASNILGAGGTPIDILKQLPTVSVSTEGVISISGKEDIQILIDGKPSGFVAIQGQSILDQLDLSTIEKIEVITNPSVIQSTNGAGGVINIIKKKNANNGFNGRINAGLGSDEWYHISSGLNYRVGSINLFLNYTLRNRKRISESTSFRELQNLSDIQLIEQNQTGVRDDKRHNAELGLDYYISENQYFTFAGNYRNRDKKDLQNRNTEISDQNDIVETRTGTIKEPETNEGWGAIVQFTSSQSDDNSLNILFDYVHSVEDEDIFREEIVSSEQPDYIDGIQSFYVDTNDRFLLDFENKSILKDSSKIAYGTQAVYRKINQTFNALNYNNDNAMYENITALNDEFDYEDFISSVYFQIEKGINKFSYEAAIRFELLNNRYSSKNINTTFKDRYFKFFPSLKLKYNFNDKTNGVFSIKKGVNRPSPNRLNPFPDVSDAFTVSVGNPELNPEVFYNFETSLKTKIKKASVTTGLFITLYTDLIQQISELGNDGLVYRFPVNINNMYHYGADVSMQVNPTKWWNQQLGGLLFNRIYEDDFIETSKKVSYQFKSTSTLSLTHQTEFQLFGSYSGPENTTQGEIKALYYIDVGIEYEFMKNKAKLLLVATDIFDTLNEKAMLINEGLVSNSNQKINTRRVYLTFDYKF